VYQFETIDLGTYRGDDYVLVGFVEPDPDGRAAYDPATDAENYGVTVARVTPDPTAANIEIIRLDTVHGQPHMDLAYLPPDTDADRKMWLDEGYTYSRMKRYLLTHWELFVDRYHHHTG